jgi:hypothetical protein
MKIKLVLIDSCGSEAAPKPLRYFVDPAVTRLDSWLYSPPYAKKIIETVF